MVAVGGAPVRHPRHYGVDGRGGAGAARRTSCGGRDGAPGGPCGGACGGSPGGAPGCLGGLVFCSCWLNRFGGPIC